MLPLTSVKIGVETYETGDWEHGVQSAGRFLAFVEKIETLANKVSTMEIQALDALERIGKFKNYPV